jgi:hypothetical protein
VVQTNVHADALPSARTTPARRRLESKGHA